MKSPSPFNDGDCLSAKRNDQKRNEQKVLKRTASHLRWIYESRNCYGKRVTKAQLSTVKDIRPTISQLFALDTKNHICDVVKRSRDSELLVQKTGMSRAFACAVRFVGVLSNPYIHHRNYVPLKQDRKRHLIH